MTERTESAESAESVNNTYMRFENVDIMLDLETIGLCDNAVITQISAVAFNLEPSCTDKIKPLVSDINAGTHLSEFNVYINAKSCVKHGLKIDGSTVEWWLKQSDEVYNNVFMKSMATKATENKVYDLPEALKMFTEWIELVKQRHCIVYGNQFNKGNIHVWGNGALADNKWIKQAYKACSMEEPWYFTQDRDVRTIVDLGRRKLKYDSKKIIFEGQQHNALDDCKHQIKYLCDIYNKINGV